MSTKNIKKIETARKENDELLKNNIDEFKAEESSSIDMKNSALN